MKKQINPTTKAYLIRSASILLLTLAICAIPFALAQRQNSVKQSGSEASHVTFAGYPNNAHVVVVGGTDNTPTPTCVPGGTPGPWTIVANYPTIIETSAVVSDGTYAYSAGGYDPGAGHPSNAVYRYDPVANSWTALANVTTAFFDAGFAYDGNTNKIYVFGGYDQNFNISNTTQIYDIATNTWTMGALMPDFRVFPRAAYYGANGKIYVISGIDSNSIEQIQTWEYDPVADSWNTSRANIPTPAAGAGISIVGQYIYMAGGYGGGGGTTTHYRYDILGDTWTAMAPVPVGVTLPASGAVGLQTYLVGGGNPFISASASRQARIAASQRAPAISYTSTYIYDIASNTWSTGPNTNVPHSFTGGAAIANRLLVVGGYNGSADTNTVEMSIIPTPCGSPTPTATATHTPTATPTATHTPTPTATATATPTPTATARPTPTARPNVTPRTRPTPPPRP